MTAPPAQHDDLLEQWRAWLEEIKHNVLALFHHREIFGKMQDALVRQGSPHSGTFSRHYTKIYVDGASMAVRRLAKSEARNEQSISLAALITAIGRNRDVLTAQRFVEMHLRDGVTVDERAHWRESALRTYERDWGDGAGNLSAVRLAADAHDLVGQSMSVADFANRTIAHIDKRGLVTTPTWGDLNQAIDSIGEMFNRYSLLLSAASWAELVPVIQGDWKDPFRSALFDQTE